MSVDWYREIDTAITVCDQQGTIIYMNERSSQMFAEDGGFALIGKNLLDCHPGLAREKVHDLLSQGQKNCYTIEKNGKRKLVYQMPWFDNGVYSGLVELALPLPQELPHFIRE